MTFLTLTVFPLEGMPPENALGLIKKGAASYTDIDLQDVTYLINDAITELLVLSTWSDLEAVTHAAALWEKIMLALQETGLKADLQRTTVFKVIREFQRYHLNAQTASISVGRVYDSEIKLEQALDWVKKSTQEFLINWPGLVRHRTAHTYDGSNLLLFHNDWVSTEAWESYRAAFSARYMEAATKSGAVEYLYTASKFLDTFKAKVTEDEPPEPQADPDEPYNIK